MNTLELDVRLLSPREKHPTIFLKFNALVNGESFIVINDHDPKPLYYQMLAELGNDFQWEYLEEGPEVWRVRITKREKTIGEIAAEDMKKVKVFMKHGIDFCCGGKKTLKEACEGTGLSYEQIKEELKNVAEDNSDINFSIMPLHQLIQYIIEKHHKYIKENKEIILNLSIKVSERHGQKHSELVKIRHYFNELMNELAVHMMKEENVLFPHIDVMSKEGQASAKFGNTSIENPIKMMHYEHDTAGELIKIIRELSNNYSVPEDACNSYNAFYRLLREFDNDLMHHIHIENNILFPRAIEMEKKLLNQ